MWLRAGVSDLIPATRRTKERAPPGLRGIGNGQVLGLECLHRARRRTGPCGGLWRVFLQLRAAGPVGQWRRAQTAGSSIRHEDEEGHRLPGQPIPNRGARRGPGRCRCRCPQHRLRLASAKQQLAIPPAQPCQVPGTAPSQPASQPISAASRHASTTAGRRAA